MGHIFDLVHTHHGCETGDWENTDGSNCANSGDFLCDTPADPNMNFNVDPDSCTWSGVNHPNCAPPEALSKYNPDTDLIMSYSTPDCLSRFSDEQVAVMRNSICTFNHLIETQTTDPQVSCGCIANINHSGLVIDGIYRVSNAITSSGEIYANQTVVYNAGKSICLTTGFIGDAGNGSVFLGKIDGCNNNNNNNPGGYKNPFEGEQEAFANTALIVKNYPNPFNGTTTIEFSLVEDESISLFVSDLLGRQVRTLLDNTFKSKGTHLVEFDGYQITPGMYYYTLQTGEQQITRKMTLVR